MTQIINDWITPISIDGTPVLRNGVEVKRKFAGLDTLVDINNEVQYCIVKYWEREYYPNGEVIKTELKNYTLKDLAYTEVKINNILYYMDALPVLSGFIQQLGYPDIIGPSRETLENAEILPLNIENGYPLRRDTREKIEKIIEEE
jgi:hypothetical protein